MNATARVWVLLQLALALLGSAAVPNYVLTVSVSPGGSVSPSGGSFPSNTVVNLTATPSNGWVFGYWTGDASGNANPFPLLMNGNKFVGVRFFRPAIITSQPQDVAVAEGDTANFSVVASGAAPLSYAWRFNGSPIPGADAATLSITNVEPTDEGAYDVVVSNPYSAATSAVATLTVLCPGTNSVLVPTDSALRAAVAS